MEATRRPDATVRTSTAVFTAIGSRHSGIDGIDVMEEYVEDI